MRMGTMLHICRACSWAHAAHLEVSDALLRNVRADGREVHVGVAGVHGASGLEELVACNQHRVQHGLTQQEVAHPLRDDDVDLLRQLNRLDGALDDLDHVGELQRGEW
jgi:hypothetical protein